MNLSLFSNQSVFSNSTDDFFYSPYRGIVTAVTAGVGTVGSVALLYLIHSWNSDRTETNAQIRAAREASNIALTNQGAATFIFCSILLSLQAWTYLTDKTTLDALRRTKYCQAIGFLYFVTMGGCIYTNAVIAVSRLVIVATSNRRTWLSAKTCSIITVAAFWTIPIFTYVSPLLGISATFGFSKDGRKCSWGSMKSQTYLTAYKSIISIVPLVIMAICYVIIFGVLRNNGQGKVAPGAARPSRRAQQYQNRLSKISCLTCTIFMIFYLPNSIFAFINPQLGTIQSDFGSWIIIWLWIGVALNPLVCILLDSNFRRRLCPTLSRRVENLRGAELTNESQPHSVPTVNNKMDA